MAAICVNFIYPNIFLRFLTGRCHGNNFFDKFGELTFIQHAIVFRNVFDYRNSNSKIFNGSTFSTYCTNLIKIGPVTPAITREKNYTFLDNMAKIGIFYQISQQLRD